MAKNLAPIAGLLLLLAAPFAEAQTHCSQLPPLTPTTTFPRCTENQLTVAGFPDHLHAYNWGGWEILRDAAGEPYGPGTLCRGAVLLPNADLALEPGEARLRQFTLRYNPQFEPCNVLGFLEVTDWASRLVPELLGLTTSDSLLILNPDNTRQYQEQTGNGVWRLYHLAGNTATIEPAHVLRARTLDGHAAFMLITDWLLQRALPAQLPLWLHHGLVEYIGEDGPHLINYMAEFRPAGPILFSAPLVDGILGRGVDPDQGTDREMFRRASYSAYLMAWHLVEHEGGLEALRDFLGQIAAGIDPDEASRVTYGMDLTLLADLLDPVSNGEPGGRNMTRQSPSRQP